MLPLDINQLDYLRCLNNSYPKKTLSNTHCFVLSRWMLCYFYLAAVLASQINTSSSDKTQLFEVLWKNLVDQKMDCLCVFCKKCVKLGLPALDQMICIVIWQHWLICLFPAASCNQQELTGRWGNTASAMHGVSVAPLVHTAFVLTARERWRENLRAELHWVVFHVLYESFIVLLLNLINVHGH